MVEVYGEPGDLAGVPAAPTADGAGEPASEHRLQHHRAAKLGAQGVLGLGERRDRVVAVELGLRGERVLLEGEQGGDVRLEGSVDDEVGDGLHRMVHIWLPVNSRLRSHERRGDFKAALAGNSPIPRAIYLTVDDTEGPCDMRHQSWG